MSPSVLASSLWDMPIHPALVHFPIAFLFTASVLIAVRHATGRALLERYIAPLLIVGVATLPIVMLAGLRDAGWLDLFRNADAGQPLIWHAIVSTCVAVSATSHAVVRARSDGSPDRLVDLSLAAATAWLLVTTGLLAGEMVYS
ncbi:MAG: DUF2231 domain-containing protein [Ilumatobacteraceae bacterium]